MISRVKEKQLVEMIRTYGDNFRGALIEDRVREELRKFCANHTIDDVYKVRIDEKKSLAMAMILFLLGSNTRFSCSKKVNSAAG